MVKGLLDFLEFAFVLFFIAMDAVALVVLVHSMGNDRLGYPIVASAVALIIVLGIKFWRSHRGVKK